MIILGTPSHPLTDDGEILEQSFTHYYAVPSLLIFSIFKIILLLVVENIYDNHHLKLFLGFNPISCRECYYDPINGYHSYEYNGIGNLI